MDMRWYKSGIHFPRERYSGLFFIDNDEFLKRKATFTDETETGLTSFLRDNDERRDFFFFADQGCL